MSVALTRGRGLGPRHRRTAHPMHDMVFVNASTSLFGRTPCSACSGSYLWHGRSPPSGTSACGLSGPWYVTREDGNTGIFIVEKAIDDTSCEARLSVFLPLGDSAVETCRVLRSEKVVIYCEVVEASQFFWIPDNFIVEDQSGILEGRWISNTSGNVVFTEQ